MRFANLPMLWLLLVLPPALMLFLWWAARKKDALLTRFIEPRLLADLLAGVSPARRKARGALLVATVVCLIFTLARPQWGFDWEETKHRGLDIVVAVDTSKSMLAEDIAPNRLARAKLAALDLMQQAKSDRLGLVAFAGNAFMECPLTIDDVAFQQCVEALDVNIIPQGGTAIAEAIETASKSFKYEADNFKVLVIFTDGEDHDPRAVEAATQAAEAGMKIFTIGIGTAEGELLRVKEADGHTGYVHDEAGNVVKSRLNEPLLQEIASAGNGFYLPLRGAKTVETLYERAFAPLPRTEGETKLVKRWHERFHWPLAVAILLLAVEMLWPERRRERNSRAASEKPLKRSPAMSTPNAGLGPGANETINLPGALTVLVLLMLPALAQASPASALRDYGSGRYDDALKEYQRLIGKKADDPRLSFNAGTAAYRDGQFEAAAKHFGDVLAAPDLALQQHAYYNLGNTFYRLGDRAQETDKKREAWEKSLKEYESTLKLDPKDGDAKFNQEFVRKKLEELKQQQQQQKQNQQNKDQQRDQNQQQQQQQSQQQEQEKQQDQPRQEQEKKAQQQPQQQAEQKNQRQQEKQPSQAKQQKEEQKLSKAAASQPSKDQQDERGQREAAAAYAGEMTPQQARQLLDAQKTEEAMIPIKPESRPENRARVFKDW